MKGSSLTSRLHRYGDEAAQMLPVALRLAILRGIPRQEIWCLVIRSPSAIKRFMPFVKRRSAELQDFLKCLIANSGNKSVRRIHETTDF
jgi:hypothetical protein